MDKFKIVFIAIFICTSASLYSHEEKFPLGYFRVYEFDYFRLSKDDAPDGVFD